MTKKMLLDDVELHFTKLDLPMLINGSHGCGASLFSVSVLADLYAQDLDVVFLCGYPMARNEFEAQTQFKDASILIADNFDKDLIRTKRVIFIPAEQPGLLIQVLDSLDSLDDRVVFFKNFDLFNIDIFTDIKNLSSIVMMGDIDKCAYKSELLSKKWVSQIYFSKPHTNTSMTIPKLEKYKGYLKSNNKEGIVSLV